MQGRAAPAVCMRGRRCANAVPIRAFPAFFPRARTREALAWCLHFLAYMKGAPTARPGPSLPVHAVVHRPHSAVHGGSRPVMQRTAWHRTGLQPKESLA